MPLPGKTTRYDAARRLSMYSHSRKSTTTNRIAACRDGVVDDQVGGPGTKSVMNGVERQVAGKALEAGTGESGSCSCLLRLMACHACCLGKFCWRVVLFGAFANIGGNV